MKLKEALLWGIQVLKETPTPTARLDVNLLLEKVLGLDSNLFLRFEDRLLSFEEKEEFTDFIQRRSQGEPIAYLTGQQGFYKYIFNVGPGVLIPRPETEFVVEATLEKVIQKNDSLRFCEFGIGSGCIGLTILKELGQAELLGFEVSKDALQYAIQNAANLQLEDRVTLKEQDVMDIEVQGLRGYFDFVLANPPYIEPIQDDEVWNKKIEKSVYDFEPHQALFAEGGTSAIENWAGVAGDILAKGGYFIFEIGFGQSGSVVQFLNDQGVFDQVEVVKDLSGIDRVVIARRV